MYKKHENIGLKCKHLLQKKETMSWIFVYIPQNCILKSQRPLKNTTKLNLPLEELKASGKAFSMNKDDDNISKRQT